MNQNWLFFLLLTAVGLASAVSWARSGVRWERQRDEEIRALAKRLQLLFRPESDEQIPRSYSFLNKLRQGDLRYAANVLSGNLEHYSVLAFDYHFSVVMEDRGQIQVYNYLLSVLILKMPGRFPELTITGENWKSRLAHLIRRGGVDFESAEFARAFQVQCRDRKFAYDFCNARMMEYLLENRDLCIEVEQDTLAVVFDSQLPVKEIEANLKRLIELRQRVPDYLFAGR